MQLKNIDTPVTLLLALRPDKDAEWQRFVTLYRKPLIEYAKSYCNSGEKKIYGIDCEDIVQDFLIRMANGETEKYDRTRGPFRSWLMKRVQSLTLDALRKQCRRVAREKKGHQWEEERQESAISSNEDYEFQKALFLQAYEVVANACDARTREIFRCCVLEGQKASEVAERFGTTVNNVHQISARIKGKVKELIESDPDLEQVVV